MNNDFLKPIETEYKGYKFRSRLEARWAVFFDSINVKWQYEIEGFTLTDGRYYLPDFKVTTEKELTYWYEIKPSGELGDGKLAQFAFDWRNKFPDDRATDFSLLSGDPYDVLNPGLDLMKEFQTKGRFYESKFCVCPRCAGINSVPIADYSNDELFITCYQCDYFTPSGSGNPVETGIITDVTPHKGVLIMDYDNLQEYIRKVESASKKARSARF